MRRYLIDTAIWIDLYEDRKGYSGEALGEYAWKLLAKIQASKDTIIVSDLLIVELRIRYSPEQITSMLLFFESRIERITATEAEWHEADRLAIERNIPRGDALQAVMARNRGLTVITRDKHFRELLDITPYYRPEDII